MRTKPVPGHLSERLAESTGVDDASHAMPASLWTQREAAGYLRVSVAYLRASSCPKVLLPPVRGRKPLVRYDPVDVREWTGNWRVA